MSNDLIPNQVLALVTIIGGLICIYCGDIPLLGGVLSIVLGAMATVFGTNMLRHIGKYSLGTGVPSIVYLLTSVGVVSYLLAIIISLKISQPLLFPIISIGCASLIAIILSLICKYVFSIQVDILTKSFVSITVASVLLIIAMSILMVQTYNPMVIYENIIQNGLIILIMIISVMAIQNPYNSSLGPNEDQYRTLSLALTNLFLLMMIVSVISIFTSRYWIIYLIILLIGWIISFKKYIKYTKHQAASIKRYGLWPKDDREN